MDGGVTEQIRNELDLLSVCKVWIYRFCRESDIHARTVPSRGWLGVPGRGLSWMALAGGGSVLRGRSSSSYRNRRDEIP